MKVSLRMRREKELMREASVKTEKDRTEERGEAGPALRLRWLKISEVLDRAMKFHAQNALIFFY